MTRIAFAILLVPTLFVLPASQSNWAYPKDSDTSNWEAVYQAPTTEYGSGHRGVDYMLATGSAIKSPFDGVVTFEGMVVDRNVVTVMDGNRYLASFEPACSEFAVGASVSLGEPFAWHCEPLDAYKYHCEDCVHFSIRSQWGYLSPEYFLGGLSPSVLRG